MTKRTDIAARLRNLHTALLCDVLDSMGFRDAFLGPGVSPLSPTARVVGTAMPMRGEVVQTVSDQAYEGLFSAFDLLEDGDVVVIETVDHVSGIWGELLSIAARNKGAVGAVMNGLTRDVEQILELDFPVFAGGFSPLDASGRQEIVEWGEPISIGDKLVKRGDWVVGDLMGVIVVPSDMAEAALYAAERKNSEETVVRDELKRGEDIREVFIRHGVL